MPVTMPVDPILARLALLMLHVPPAVASDNEVVCPIHKLVLPEIAAIVFTFTVTVLLTVQPNL